MAEAGGLVKRRRSKSQFKEPDLSNSYLDSGTGRVIQISGQEQIAMQYDKHQHAHLPEGFCVINVDIGNEPHQQAPISVTHFDWTIKIPRGVDCIVPLHHVQILENAVITTYQQPVYGEALIAIPTKLHPFTVKKWPKADAAGVPIEVIQSAQAKHESIDVDE